jgi:tripartite-type tricarboxylate transporter receptor subunit TctC
VKHINEKTRPGGLQRLGLAPRLAAAALMLVCAAAPAQDYPAKPINMVVAIGPGSPQDIVTRALVARAAKSLGQPFVVTNNGAAGGAVALAATARAKPDGYHLISNGTPMITILPQVRPVPYKLDDFEPIMHFGAGQYGLAVRADAPWKTLKELVEFVKKNPGKVSFGTLEAGTFLHTAMYMIQKQEGLDWIHVPYPGGGVGTNALLGGHITAESGAGGLFQHARNGRVRMLATYGERRSKSMPDVPTIRELGYDFRLSNLIMLGAPKGTSQVIVKQLDAAFRKAMDDPEFIQVMDKFETDIVYRGPAELKTMLEEMVAAYGRIVKDLNIRGTTESAK